MEFTSIIEGFTKTANETDIYTVVSTLLEDLGYMEYLKNMGFEGQTRLENVNEFLNNIIAFSKENPEGKLKDFLEEIALVTTLDDYNENNDHVVLMTVHASKGLEFDTVFLIGMEEGVFPGKQADFDNDELEEERRLCYVGVTRARKKLFLSNANTRMIFGQTNRNKISRFIDEIGEENLELVDKCLAKRTFTETEAKRYERSIQGKTTSSKSTVGGKTAQKEKVLYEIGETVQHKIFGQGTLKASQAMGNDSLLTIEFEGHGLKKIMANFANLKKV